MQAAFQTSHTGGQRHDQLERQVSTLFQSAAYLLPPVECRHQLLDRPVHFKMVREIGLQQFHFGPEIFLRRIADVVFVIEFEAATVHIG